MEELREQLKAMTEDPPQLFRRLKEILLSDSDSYNEVIQLDVQYKNNQQEWLGGRIAKAEADLVTNRLIQALLVLIDGLEENDLKAGITATQASAPSLHDYHSYTCDRVDQSDHFQKIIAGNRNKKIHFIYLYGLDLQSHRGLFKRIAYDLEGRLQDYLNPNIKLTARALQIELTFDVSRDPDIYRQNILKSLLASLSVRVNEHEPLLEKDIIWLQSQSPSLQGLGKDDFVCIFVAISEWDWDKEITPQVTRWFIDEFCKGDLPGDFPTIFFFFGIIYEEDNSPIEQEVEEIVRQSTRVEALPELNMVTRRDIGAWFNKYSFIAPSTRELKELRSRHFGNTAEHYMDDVEIILRKLIDDYNKQFF